MRYKKDDMLYTKNGFGRKSGYTLIAENLNEVYRTYPLAIGSPSSISLVVASIEYLYEQNFYLITEIFRGECD